MRETLLLAFVLTAEVAPSSAQLFQGQITEAESTARLAAADVSLLNQAGDPLSRTLSDHEGFFHLRAPRAGSYRLRVSLIGYLPFTSELITAENREVMHISIRLSARALPLNALVVTTRRQIQSGLEDFERRQLKQGSGVYLSGAELRRRIAINATSALVGVPGVTLLEDRSGRRSITLLRETGVGRCAANVYIDGVLITSSHVDDVLTPDRVAAVEIYSRRTSVPVEFMKVNNGCGVVAFWTRELDRATVGFGWKKLAAATGFIIAVVLLAR